MKKKRNIYLIVYLLIAVIIIVVSFLIDKKNKKEIAEAYASSINNTYTYWLWIKGDFSYEGNKIYAENLEYDEKLLMVDVGFVNYENGNEQFTIEQLYEEYEAFLNGEDKDKYKNLDEYVKYIHEYTRVGSDYDDYCDSIYDELELIREEKEKKGEEVIIDNASVETSWSYRSRRRVEYFQLNIVDGSTEEIQEAINRANKRE